MCVLERESEREREREVLGFKKDWIGFWFALRATVAKFKCGGVLSAS